MSCRRTNALEVLLPSAGFALAPAGTGSSTIAQKPLLSPLADRAARLRALALSRNAVLSSCCRGEGLDLKGALPPRRGCSAPGAQAARSRFRDLPLDDLRAAGRRRLSLAGGNLHEPATQDRRLYAAPGAPTAPRPLHALLALHCGPDLACGPARDGSATTLRALPQRAAGRFELVSDERPARCSRRGGSRTRAVRRLRAEQPPRRADDARSVALTMCARYGPTTRESGPSVRSSSDAYRRRRHHGLLNSWTSAPPTRLLRADLRHVHSRAGSPSSPTVTRSRIPVHEAASTSGSLYPAGGRSLPPRRGRARQHRVAAAGCQALLQESRADGGVGLPTTSHSAYGELATFLPRVTATMVAVLHRDCLHVLAVSGRA